MKPQSPTSSPADAVAAFLDAFDLGTHPETEETPERVAEMWNDSLLSGEGVDPKMILEKRIPDQSGVIVILRSIPFHGVCPHHLVPFFGHVDLAYEPDGFIVGLGALERLVAVLSRRLILQEDLTGRLVDTMEDALNAKGVGCRIEAQHLCLMLRGREPRSTQLVTQRATGSLRERWDLFFERDKEHG